MTAISIPESEIYRILLRVVLPFGTALWAFAESVRIGMTGPVHIELMMVGVFVVTIFIAFSQFVEVTADRIVRPIDREVEP